MSQTLDQIFLAAAQKKPDTIALTDCPNAERLGLGTITGLTYTHAQRYIQQTAQFLRQFGLNDGDIILVQLPHIAETPLILLSLFNAGLVPCCLPTHWRKSEIEQAFNKLNAKGMIVHQSTPNYDPFSSLFEIAANHLNLRFIFGLSQDQNLPDGVTPLPDIHQSIACEPQSPTNYDITLCRSQEQVALIGWSSDQEGIPHPVAYTHIQMMANAHLIAQETKMRDTPSILTAYSPTTLPGMIAAFVPWITQGGTLHITSQLKQKNLLDQFQNHTIDQAVLPHGLEQKLQNALENQEGATTESAQTKRPHLTLIASTPTHAKKTPQAPNSSVFYNLNGLCLIASQVPHEEKGILKLGNAEVAHNDSLINPPFIQTRLQGATQKAGDLNQVLKGRLEVSGLIVGFTKWHDKMTTSPHSNFNEHWEQTHLSALLIDQALSNLEIERNQDTIYHGANQLSGLELDRLYQTYPGFVDAAAFSIMDPLLGERLFAAIIPRPGDPLSYEDFKKHLMDQNISPVKIPEKLVTVTQIPRSQDGIIERKNILPSH